MVEGNEQGLGSQAALVQVLSLVNSDFGQVANLLGVSLFCLAK